MYAGLPEGYSGGPQHKAVLQQDCYAVDVRCVDVRPEYTSLFEEITGIPYEERHVEGRFSSFDQEVILEMSMRLGEEIRKKGLRVVWDPKVVKKVK